MAIAALAFRRGRLLSYGRASAHRLRSLRRTAVPVVLLHHRPARPVLALRGDFSASVLRIGICPSSRHISSPGSLWRIGISPVIRLSGPAVASPPLRKTRLLLVLSLAYAHFGPAVLKEGLVSKRNFLKNRLILMAQKTSISRFLRHFLIDICKNYVLRRHLFWFRQWLLVEAPVQKGGNLSPGTTPARRKMHRVHPCGDVL